MAEPSAYEQYLLELVNADRATAGVQPLADSDQLNAAAETHSQWMIATDTFSHTGANGSSATERMQAAGFQFTGSWSNGENIGWMSLRNPAGYNDEVQQLHVNLMNSPGHRANLLNASFSQIGLGFEVGEYQGWQGAFVTEDFANSGAQKFLTGVAYDDLNDDGFYQPGEGLGGITVTAGSATGAVFTVQTYASGGYDLALPSGGYTVTFSGANIATSSQHVDVGASNVKLDLIDPAAASGQPAPGSGVTVIAGTAGADTLQGVDSGDNRLRGDDGADYITGNASGFNDINGNKGEDTIVGRSSVGDWLLGGQGDDHIDASQSNGRNIINGNLGNDVILSGTGGDTLRGGQGDDQITGGVGNDWISGDLGANTVTGGGGADTFRVAAGGVITVADFHASEGDRVQLGAGAHSSAYQSGADVHVDLTDAGAGSIILPNVQLNSLQAGWLFQA